MSALLVQQCDFYLASIYSSSLCLSTCTSYGGSCKYDTLFNIQLWPTINL